ncbi:kynureninase [Spartinivicinus poritis]|uniref:Kynureninase n=1 Tax=Spartinivicinus poritis TaxID=2994640 RepID=A0ABT5U6Q4_9GAMM|nr:kynureninase [Spartinivicinus sp. A2-2]MDE1460859.1 kynureninase [Spartinivicinus sp. A2-2]
MITEDHVGEVQQQQYQPGEAFAHQLDRQDPLRELRHQFNIPTTVEGKEEYYFCGNSLGLQPKLTQQYLDDVLTNWAQLGVKGHFQGNYPWLPYHEFLTEQMASLVGAKPCEVVMMNSLTVNLHLMMVSFFNPTAQRFKIVIEEHAFPSDHYAVISQLAHHGISEAEGVQLLSPKPGEELLDEVDILNLIETEGDSIALMLLPGVQYYTGQVLDIKVITQHAHRKGIIVGVDLAHAAGNIELQLHDWNVDFACWCSYKYLNSGPGSVGGCFIHQQHVTNTELKRFAGWWGHDKTSRFEMTNQFNPIPTAEGWQLSNPPILSLAAIRASLDTFTMAGGIKPLREKSIKLTGYLAFLLASELADAISIITPKHPIRRGCQLSLKCHVKQLTGKQLLEQLEAKGVTTDWREPDVIRVAPVPLYNSFADVYQFVQILKAIVQGSTNTHTSQDLLVER